MNYLTTQRPKVPVIETPEGYTICPTCGQPVEYLKDDPSRREYLISGMCQACQDSVFHAGR